jgi:hypothetical protein
MPCAGKWRSDWGVDDPSYPEDERVVRSLGLDDSQIQGVIDNFGRKDGAHQRAISDIG